MEKVIISGADGFVGSNTVKLFLEKGVEVLAIDVKKTPENLPPHPLLQYLQCNIADTERMQIEILHDYYDTFINFAWAGSAGQARTDYILQMQNAFNTVECMKMARELGCKRFICAGSIMEYEVMAAVGKQGNKPGMNYMYGLGKYVAHCLCKTIGAEIGIDVLWPLITNAYGAGENSPRFINSVLRKIINGEPLYFTIATQNYDFVYITDVAKAFYLIALKGIPFCEYVIGSSHAQPLKDFILEIQQVFAPEREMQFGKIPFTGVNIPLEIFDTKKIQQDCGFKSSVSFEEGIQRTMEWLKLGKNYSGGGGTIILNRYNRGYTGGSLVFGGVAA